jgi:hypothetical protein
MPAFGPDNPFFPGFEEDPEGQRANYFRFQDQWGKSPNQKRWFQDQFQETLDRYKGGVGAVIAPPGGGPGGQPSQSLSGFLDDYFGQGGQAQQSWQGMSPQSRGRQDARYAPSSRWMINSGPQF